MSNPGITNLAAWWQLNETSGTRYDSRSSSDLADNATVLYSAGKQGNAAQFVSAQSEYLSIADNTYLSTGDIDFTVGAWVYLDTKTADMVILSKFENVGNHREYRLFYNNGTDRFSFSVSSNGTAVLTLADNVLGSPVVDTWYFITASHDSVSDTIAIQINAGAATTTGHSTGVNDDASPFHIGATGRAAAGEYFDGRIDEAFLYKRILTSAERTWLYNAGAGRSYDEVHPLVVYGGGSHRLGFQVYADSTRGEMIADWSGLAIGIAFETNEHGYGNLTAFIPLDLYRSYQVYDAIPLAHVVLGNGAFHAFEGRIEDRALVDGGIRITAFGYQRALSDLVYTSLWSSTHLDEWRIMTATDRDYTKSELYTIDKKNRIYIGLKPKTIYTIGGLGRVGWPIAGRNDFAYASFDYDVTLPASLTAKLVSTTTGLSGVTVTEEWSKVGNGASQTGSFAQALAAATAWTLFFQVEPTDSYTVEDSFIGVEKGSRPDLTGGWQSFTANNKYATKFTATSTFTATKMRAYLINFAAGENCKLGIYSDGGAAPSTLLGVTAEINGEGRTGYYNGELVAGVSLTSGTAYWLAILAGSSFACEVYTASHTSNTNADTYSDGFTAAWGSSSAQTYGLIITAFADEFYLEITNLRVTASDATIYADDVAKDIVSHISGVNSTQLSSSTILIQSPTVNLHDALYLDESANRILTDLVNVGDNSTPPDLWEWGVWEGQKLHLRQRGSAGQTWYTDVASVNIDSTIDTLVNSAYALYKDEEGYQRRTADNTDVASVAKYGITRYQAVQTPTTDITEAGIWRDAKLNSSKDITPRARVVCEGIYTASGARVPNFIPRSGDTLVLRNLPPTGSETIDKIRSFRISNTRYYIDTDVLEPTPEDPLNSLEILVAHHEMELKK